VVAGGLALSAGGQAWATVVVARREPLPPAIGVVEGVDAAPLVPAAGLVLLAAAVALLAVRGRGRVAVGVLMALSGIALVVAGVRAIAGGLDDAASSVGLDTGDRAVDITVGWPLLTAVAGVLGLLAGLLVVARGRSWPGMSRRYERAAAPATAPAPRTDEERAQLAWKALDRGEDPTR
jgi:uncharacterized membrane protein (TIGR02234 family)